MSPRHRSPRDFRLLVFDWDGTLLDSIGVIVACTRAALEELQLPVPPEARLRGVIGLGLRETIEALLPSFDEELAGRLAGAYRRHWWDGYHRRSLLIAGAEEALRHLHRRGFELAIATGKSRQGLESDLERLGIGALFSTTCTSSEAPSKPAPEMLNRVLGELGRSPTEALMIGDTAFDLEMARQAGVAALAVTSGGHRREELERAGPLACLESVAELPRWLGAGR